MESLREQNATSWMEIEILKRGTPNQRERWAYDLLPEEELLELARSVIFSGLENIRRWSGRDSADMIRVLKQDVVCAENTRGHNLTHTVEDVAELTAAQWDVLTSIRTWATAAAKAQPWLRADKANHVETVETVAHWITGAIHVETVAHWITCSHRICGAEETAPVAKITVQWAGRTLVREYRLQVKD